MKPREVFYSERPAFDDRRKASAQLNQHIDDYLAAGGSIERLPTSPGFVDLSPVKPIKRRALGDPAPKKRSFA